MPHAPGIGAIFGIVSENGVPVEDAPVTLLDRTGPTIVRRQRSAYDGGFSFSGLNTETDDYMVIASDESFGDGNPPKNALIQDRVTPVSAHVGSFYNAAWYKTAQATIPLTMFPSVFGWADGKLSLLTPTNFNGYVNPVGGTLVAAGETSPFVDGANLPVVETNASYLILEGGSSLPIQVSNAVASLAVVADFSTPWAVTQCMSGQLAETNSFVSLMDMPWLRVEFTGTALTIRFETAVDTSIYYDLDRLHFYSSGKLYSHSLSEVPTGFEFVSVAFRANFIVELTIGETTVVLDNTTVPSGGMKISEYLYPSRAALHTPVGTGAPVISTGTKFAFYMFSGTYITDTQAQALRTALLEGGFPTETGYAREIVQDLPAFYYRTDEVNAVSGKISEHLEGDISGFVNGITIGGESVSRELTVTNGQTQLTTPSLIPGRAATVFDGSYTLYHDRFMGLPNYMNFTLGFLMRPTTISGDHYILKSTWINGDYTTLTITTYYTLNLTSAGKLRLFLNRAVDVDITFDYTFEVDTWYEIRVKCHLDDGKAYLYVNGVLEQTESVSPIPLTGRTDFTLHLNNSVGWADGYCRYIEGAFTVGGLYDGAVTNGFIGALAEIVGFSYPVSEQRLEEQYAARTVI